MVDVKELDEIAPEEPGARTPFERQLRERTLLGAARRIVGRYGLLVDELGHNPGEHSSGAVTLARREFARHLRDLGWSTPMVARLLGYKDHTTIVRLLRPKGEK